MRTTRTASLAVLLLAFALPAGGGPAPAALDRPPGEFELPYSPADGAVVSITPPAFVWIPVARGARYALQVGPAPDPATSGGRTVRGITMASHALREALAPGRWAWRYGVESSDGTVSWSRVRAFTVAVDARAWPYPGVDAMVGRVPRGRPRLFVRAEEVAAYRGRARDGDLRGLAAPIVRAAERDLGGPLPPEPDFLPRTQPDRGRVFAEIIRGTRPAMDAMERVALAYLLTGDARFADEARRRLRHFFSWDPLGPTELAHNDEPAMWMMMRGVRAYDWIHDRVPPEEREAIERVMRVRAEQMHQVLRRRPFESNPYESHAGRIIGFLGEAALAFIHEWPEARDWLDYVATGYWTSYPAWGGDDGGWAEGPAYWGSYMNFMLHFAVALRTAAGADIMGKPFFANTPHYAVYTAPPYHRLAPFGDGQHSRVELGSLMYWFSSVLRDPVARWYADARRRGPSSDILGVVLADATLAGRPPTALPQSRVFPSVGLVAMHSALGDPDNDIYLLLRSSPYGSHSHGHSNQNAFTVEAYGEALAIASGYYPWYASPHHDLWTRETRASNAITINGGQGQGKRSIRARGRIEAFATGGGYDYASGDATPAYEGRLLRAVRRIVHVRPGVFVVYDEVAAPQPVTWEWWLHALSRMEVDEGAAEVRVREGRAGMVVRFLDPGGLAFAQTDRFTVPPEDGRPNQWHLTSSTRSAHTATVFLTVLMPHRAAETSGLPRITKVEGEGALGVALAWPDGRRDLVGFRRPGRSEAVRIEGIEADAAVFAVGTAPGGVLRRWLVGQGRRLSLGDRDLAPGGPERTATWP
ncbi:MAG: DUF4962 domain-containing protein [bacterium]|nr:DUF4962 domain-containing protein [bacterium]